MATYWPKRVLFKLRWSICRNVLKRLRRRRLMEPPDGQPGDVHGPRDRCVNRWLIANGHWDG